MFFSQGSERFVLEVGAGMGPKEDQIGSCAGLDVRIKSYQLFYAVLTSLLVNISTLASRCMMGAPFIHINVTLLSFFFAVDGHQSMTFAL